jgi:putative oxidoreductase
VTPGDLGLLVLRLVVGLTFAGHGAQKAFGWWKGPGWAGWYGAMTRMGFRPANLWAVVSIGAELVGGLLLAVGLLTPFAAVALVGLSVVIVVKVHWAKGFWNRDGGFEFPLSLLAGVVALVGTGPGSASLDAALGLSYPADLRGLLIAVGVLGALVALAISRVRPVERPAAAGPS